MFEYITKEDVITSSGKYPDRRKYLNPNLEKRIEDLVSRVNRLLDLCGVPKVKLTLSSGLREPGSGGHPKGMALDIQESKQDNQVIGKLIASRPDALKACGLMIEDLNYTKGKYTDWVHLDTIARPYRASYSFIPV